MGVLENELIDDIAKISNEMDLPANFLLDLKENDDWSFVIKTHAFLEALTSYVIAETIHRKELANILSRLDMGNLQYGKVVLSERLSLIKSDGKKFLLRLNSLRNYLAHNVKHINFNFTEYLQSLDKNQKKEFLKSFSYFASEEDIRDHYDVVTDIVLNHTKVALWLCAMHFTAIMWWTKEREKLQTLISALNKYAEKIKS